MFSRLMVLALLVSSFPQIAQAQKTKAAILTEIPILCPIGGVGTCTATDAQQIWKDIVNSIMPTAPVTANDYACFSGTTGLLSDCGNSTVVTSLGSAVGAIPLSSNLRITGGNTLDLATSIALAGETITANSFSAVKIQDALGSAAITTQGTITSGICDPGYVNGPAGSGPCTKVLFTPTTGGQWGGLTLEAVNARAIFGSINGVANPELICADAGGPFGMPIWGNSGSNQAGCGFQGQTRTGSGAPVNFNITNAGAPQASFTGSISTTTLTVASGFSGVPLVVGETIVGSGITGGTMITGFISGSGGLGTYTVNHSQSIGSEAMVAGPSGAEGSMQVGVFGGSLDGLTQNVVTFFNAAICSAWNNGCSGTPGAARLGEIAGNGMTPDGIFTQTENVSMNFYADSGFSGTHADGSYTALTNIVFREGIAASSPETVVGGFYNPGTLALGAWNVSGNSFTGSPGTLTFKDGGTASNLSGATILLSNSGQLQAYSSVVGAGAFVTTQTGSVTSGRVACWTANGILRQGVSGTSC